MAKINYTEKGKDKGDAFDGVEAVYGGKTSDVSFYRGDTRPRAVKIQALKDYLRVRIMEATQPGDPLPEVGE